LAGNKTQIPVQQWEFTSRPPAAKPVVAELELASSHVHDWDGIAVRNVISKFKLRGSSPLR
jgi:hypothetical protein